MIGDLPPKDGEVMYEVRSRTQDWRQHRPFALGFNGECGLVQRQARHDDVVLVGDWIDDNSNRSFSAFAVFVVWVIVESVVGNKLRMWMVRSTVVWVRVGLVELAADLVD